MREELHLSAGHHEKDPGAVNKDGIKEANLNIEFRELVFIELKRLPTYDTIITDYDWETNTQYQLRLKNRKKEEKTITFDIHFNAGVPTANGSECVIAKGASQMSKDIAREIQNVTCSILGTRDRGVITDDKTARGKIGILHLEGPAVLVEICFITNESDMKKYHANKQKLAAAYAKILSNYNQKLNKK